MKTATTTTVSTATAPKQESGCIRKGLAKTVTGELTMTDERFVDYYDEIIDTETNIHYGVGGSIVAIALTDLLNKLSKEAITMSKYVYEIWYEFYDGTMANNNGYTKKIKTYLDKEKAYAEKDRLNSEAQFPSEMPYSVREVKLDD